VFGDRGIRGAARLEEWRLDDGHDSSLDAGGSHALRHVRADVKQVEHVVDDAQDLYAVDGVQRDFCGHV